MRVYLPTFWGILSLGAYAECNNTSHRQLFVEFADASDARRVAQDDGSVVGGLLEELERHRKVGLAESLDIHPGSPRNVLPTCCC